MKKLQELISEHPFFKGLSADHLAKVSGCAKQVHFKPGEMLFREGSEANHFYIVRHGHVALQFHLPKSGGLTFETLHEGDVEGFAFLFPPYLWPFDGVANDETVAIQFDGKCLRSKCDEDTSLGYELMKRFGEIIAERLQSARLRLLDMYK